MADPIIQMNAVDGVWVRQMYFEQEGDVMEGHTHAYNHMTLLAKGKLRVIVDNQETIFEAPKIIFIHKDKCHTLVAMENHTVAYCIHALRDAATGEIIEGIGVPAGIKLQEFLTEDTEETHGSSS